MIRKGKSGKLILHAYIMGVGRVVQSVKRLATGWKVWGSNVCGNEIFRTCPDRPRGPLSVLCNGYRVFCGGKERPRRDAEHSPSSIAIVKKEQSYTSSLPMGRTACTEPRCLYSRAIPLLPLWTLPPVQSLGACTIELYLYSPYGPSGLYRASVPVQQSYTFPPPMGCTAFTEPQCLYSRAIPLLPIWAVLPVQSLSACTRVHFTLPLNFLFLDAESTPLSQSQRI